jgi:hypothetical protein
MYACILIDHTQCQTLMCSHAEELGAAVVGHFMLFSLSLSLCVPVVYCFVVHHVKSCMPLWYMICYCVWTRVVTSFAVSVTR